MVSFELASCCLCQLSKQGERERGLFVEGQSAVLLSHGMTAIGSLGTPWSGWLVGWCMNGLNFWLYDKTPHTKC